MSKIHWDKDPVGLGNGRVGFHTDAVTGDFTIVHAGDPRPVMNVNKKMRNAYDKGALRKDEWHNVANLDMGAIAYLKSKYGLDIFNNEHLDKIVEKLHQPEYQYLKASNADVRKAPAREYFQASTYKGKPGRISMNLGKSTKIRSGVI